MSMLSEAEKKLSYASYLLRGTLGGDSFADGALKHIFAAANLAARSLTNLNEIRAGSPKLVQQTLQRFDEPEIQSFANEYVKIWSLSSAEQPDAKAVRSALQKTEVFLKFVRTLKVSEQ